MLHSRSRSSRRETQQAPRATSGIPVTKPRGLGPSRVLPHEQKTRPTLAMVLEAPWARAHGHTLPERARSKESQQDIAVHARVS